VVILTGNTKKSLSNKTNTRKYLIVICLILGVFFSGCCITAHELFKRPNYVLKISETYYNKTIAEDPVKIAELKESLKNQWNKLKEEAIVNYFTEINMFLPEHEARRYAKAVIESSQTFNVDPFLISAIIAKESTVDCMARSSVAHGLMQIHWGVHKQAILDAFGSRVNSVRDIYVPETNIDIGTWIFSNYLNSAEGDIKKALGKYYGEQNSSYINNILTRYSKIVSNFYEISSIEKLVLNNVNNGENI
jgi:soluble lytic murein transglycosylase-like protein